MPKPQEPAPPADIQLPAEEVTPKDWSPVAVDTETGHEMHGDFPLGRAARLAALAAKGRKTDPDGIVSRDDIAAYTGAAA